MSERDDPCSTRAGTPTPRASPVASVDRHELVGADATVRRGAGAPVRAPAAFIMLALRRVQNLRRRRRGRRLGLLVSVLAHWPGTAHPEPQWFADDREQYRRRALGGGRHDMRLWGPRTRGPMVARLPSCRGCNLFYASALVNRRLGLRPNWRIRLRTGLTRRLFVSRTTRNPGSAWPRPSLPTSSSPGSARSSTTGRWAPASEHLRPPRSATRERHAVAPATPVQPL